MNLKNKIANNMSLLFCVILGFILVSIYVLFARFRTEEFKSILSDRLATVSSVVKDNAGHNEVRDLNTINNIPTYSLQQEQILVFDKDFQLVYKNGRPGEVDWNRSDLTALKTNGEIYRRQDTSEIFGKKIKENYYLVQAEDTFGTNKLQYLRTLMLISFLIASALIWLLSFLFAKSMIAPLDLFQQKITNISVNNLGQKLPENNRKDEINLLAKVFNTMLDRISLAYSAQKEFTASASHEIKTPLARIVYQLQNLEGMTTSEEPLRYISGIKKEVFQLSDTVDTLLLLAKIEEDRNPEMEEVRLDEVLFGAYEKVKRLFPAFEMDFSIAPGSADGELTVRGVKPLLEIVFINLLKNAEIYSDNHIATVELCETENMISVAVSNRGSVIPKQERGKIFEAFRRGSNSQNKSGSGLGLQISKRILDFHRAHLEYSAHDEVNVFRMSFPKSENKDG